MLVKIIYFIGAVFGFFMIAGVMILWMLAPELKSNHPYLLCTALYVAFLGGMVLIVNVGD